MFFALVLFALVLVAGTLHRTGLIGVFALSSLSVLWLLVNKGVEHASLLTLSTGHGITPLDAAGLAGLVLVVAQIVRSAWPRRRSGDRPDDLPDDRRELSADTPEEPVDKSS